VVSGALRSDGEYIREREIEKIEEIEMSKAVKAGRRRFGTAAPRAYVTIIIVRSRGKKRRLTRTCVVRCYARQIMAPQWCQRREEHAVYLPNLVATTGELSCFLLLVLAAADGEVGAALLLASATGAVAVADDIKAVARMCHYCCCC
jgi:hypothetical protein